MHQDRQMFRLQLAHSLKYSSYILLATDKGMKAGHSNELRKRFAHSEKNNKIFHYTVSQLPLQGKSCAFIVLKVQQTAFRVFTMSYNQFNV